jgi:hypothetical protein
VAVAPKQVKVGPYEPQPPPGYVGVGGGAEGDLQPYLNEVFGAPSGAPADAKALSEWAYREFLAIAAAMSETDSLELRAIRREPAKPREGMIVYADGVSWDPGGGAGVYVYRVGAWKKLQEAP